MRRSQIVKFRLGFAVALQNRSYSCERHVAPEAPEKRACHMLSEPFRRIGKASALFNANRALERILRDAKSPQGSSQIL